MKTMKTLVSPTFLTVSVGKYRDVSDFHQDLNGSNSYLSVPVQQVYPSLVYNAVPRTIELVTLSSSDLGFNNDGGRIGLDQVRNRAAEIGLNKIFSPAESLEICMAILRVSDWPWEEVGEFIPVMLPIDLTLNPREWNTKYYDTRPFKGGFSAALGDVGQETYRLGKILLYTGLDIHPMAHSRFVFEKTIPST